MFANLFLCIQGFGFLAVFHFFHKSRFGWYQLFVPPMWLLIADDLDEIPYGTLISVGWIAIRSNPTNKIPVPIGWDEVIRFTVLREHAKMRERAKQVDWTMLFSFKRLEGKHKLHPGKLTWNPKCRFGWWLSFSKGVIFFNDFLGSNRSFSRVYGYGCGGKLCCGFVCLDRYCMYCWWKKSG